MAVIGLVDTVDDRQPIRTAYLAAIGSALYAAVFVFRLERERQRQLFEMVSAEHQRGHRVIEATRLAVRIRAVLRDLERLDDVDPQARSRTYTYAQRLAAAAEDVVLSLLALEAEDKAMELAAVAEEVMIMLLAVDQEPS